jgi:hypothetical protein
MGKCRYELRPYVDLSGQLRASVALTPRKAPQCPLNRRLGEPPETVSVLWTRGTLLDTEECRLLGCGAVLILCSSETSVHTRSTRRHIPEHSILHSHRCENLKSYNFTCYCQEVIGDVKEHHSHLRCDAV